MTNATDLSLRDRAEALLALLESQKPDPEPFDINHFVEKKPKQSENACAIAGTRSNLRRK